MRLIITLALSIFVLMSCGKDNFTTDKKEGKMEEGKFIGFN